MYPKDPCILTVRFRFYIRLPQRKRYVNCFRFPMVTASNLPPPSTIYCRSYLYHFYRWNYVYNR